jgi:hypothetical protein
MSKDEKTMAKTIESRNFPIDVAIATFARLNPDNVSRLGVDIKSLKILFVGEASALYYPAGWYYTGTEFTNAGNCDEGFAIAVPMEKHVGQQHGFTH